VIATIVSGGLKAVIGVLALVGLSALLLGVLIAAPLRAMPELTSISTTARAVDRSTMPDIERFQARDGTVLGYRHYPAHTPAGTQIVILVHGSSGSSVAVHALAEGLAERGIETFAPDIRGHGASGMRGDIAYLGQLEDDLADLVGMIRKSAPNASLTLMGHSSGGGFALRVAASPIQGLFIRTVLLAPYLGYDVPSSRPDSGGWASADVPRYIALALLQRLGIPCCESLPTLAFAVAPNSSAILVPAYSYRLMRNFATRGYRADFAAVTKPVTLIAGAADELMLSDKYADMVHAVAPAVDVKLIDGINHMAIVSDPRAVAMIADDVVHAGSGS
jgi:alpha-beta hydrolase superfamily lysophospholipase